MLLAIPRFAVTTGLALTLAGWPTSTLAQSPLSSMFGSLRSRWEQSSGQPLGNRLQGIIDQGRQTYSGMQQQAMARLAAAQPSGTCEERVQRFEALAPEAERFAAMARDVYRGRGDDMAARNMPVMTIAPGHKAYQDHNGDFYAETYSLPVQSEIVIVFRGTRRDSRSDIVTDVANFAGEKTPYHDWARALAAHIAGANPGIRVIATGHSLGGGLALTAALAVPMVTAVAFDPAGLSKRAWDDVSPQDQARAVATSTAFVAVTSRAMDPVSAGSIVGMSVIPARIYAIPVIDGGSPIERHRIAVLADGIQQAAAQPNKQCGYDGGDLGVEP